MKRIKYNRTKHRYLCEIARRIVGTCKISHTRQMNCRIASDINKIIRQVAVDHFADLSGMIMTKRELAEKLGCDPPKLSQRNFSENIDLVEKVRKEWISLCEIADEWAAKDWAPRTESDMKKYAAAMELKDNYRDNPTQFKTVVKTPIIA